MRKSKFTESQIVATLKQVEGAPRLADAPAGPSHLCSGSRGFASMSGLPPPLSLRRERLGQVSD